jgi:MoaA/NifB/PqqE/SkfB family radical SAM enzyme
MPARVWKTIRSAVDFALSPHTLRQKLNYARYALGRKTGIARYGPVHLSVVTTGRCNLACAMCPTHSLVIPGTFEWRQQETRDMDFGLFKSVVDRFDTAFSVSLIGSGEPLLVRDFFRMAAYAAGEKRMSVTAVSNGTLIDRFIPDIVKSRLTQISISVNGHTPDEFHRLTGNPPEMFPKITENVKALARERDRSGSKVRIEASFILDQQNWRLAPDFIRAGEELGVDHIDFINFLPSPFDGFRADERCLFVQNRDMVDFLRNKAVPAHMKGRVSLPTLLDSDKSQKGCACHFTTLRFDGNGNYSGCTGMLLNMEGAGKVTDTEVWNSAFFQDRRALFIKDGKDCLYEPCRTCWYNYGVKPW